MGQGRKASWGPVLPIQGRRHNTTGPTKEDVQIFF